MIDLRSDTVTKPTKAMLKTMFEANIGDDVFGEDPTVIALEEKLADMFGMEAGLFCPSGTMTNQIAIKCLTQPLEEIILDQTAHVYRYEGGGIMFNSNASVRLLNGERGKITAEMIASEINPDGIYYPKSSLVVLENTVNKGGGICYTLEEIKPIHQLCKQKDLKLHLDGARIFNALSFTKDKAVEYGEYFDIDYRMGGLLPSWTDYQRGPITQPSDVASHWEEVCMIHGIPLDGDIWLEDPLPSSYPPSIAFKAAQMQDGDLAILFLRRIKEIFLGVTQRHGV